MTRETKIGLLVGLAFIIVVAILLTDHTTTATDPRPASLPDVGSNVRQSVASPAAPPPPAETVRAPIPTRADLTPPPPAEPARQPVRIVEVGPGSPSATPIAISQNPADDRSAAGEPVPQLPPLDGVPPPPTSGRNGKPLARGGPADLVSQHPDEFVNAADAASARTAAQGKNGKPATAPVAPPKTYVAEAGDSVSKIAAKAMGGNTKANRDALVKANASLQAEGNLVYVGKSYVIPSAGATAPAAEQATADRRQPPATEPGPFRAPPPSAPNTVWYTVKENDNLWRIAARELGDGNRWTQIKDVNRDVLKGGETVKANMRIRLPKSPAATASAN